jgi:VanZ family protein
MLRTGLPPELEHVLAYAAAGGVFAVVYGRKGAPASLALLGLGAVGFELAQNFVPDRMPRVVDAACSVTGSLIGITGGLMLRWLWSKRHGIWRGRPAL